MLIASVAFIIFVMCGGARANPTCAPWDNLKAALAETWGEIPIGVGVVNQYAMVEVLASPTGKTFTVVVLDTHGMACTVISGADWELLKKPAPAGVPG